MKSFQIDDITTSVFFKQFALLISSGIPAGDALLVISEESESAEFSDLLKHASDLVKTGSYVSEALGALNLFSKKFRALGLTNLPTTRVRLCVSLLGTHPARSITLW
jgi:type II secretory pathway component PulF